MNIREYNVANIKNISSEGIVLGSSAKTIGCIIKIVKVILLIIMINVFYYKARLSLLAKLSLNKPLKRILKIIFLPDISDWNKYQRVQYC